MNHIKHLYQQDQYRNQLDLQFLQINDLAPLIPFIQKFNKMMYLSVHGNRLKSLPDMSNLKNLKQIDITNNPFSSVEDFLQGLETLPNLTSLNCNLQLKEQRQKILKSLPKLQYLNKFAVKRDKKHQQIIKTSPNLINYVDDVKSWYSQLLKLLKLNNISSEKLYEEYQKQIQILNNQLKINLKDKPDSNNIDVEAKVAFVKFKLIDFCFDKLLLLLERTEGYLCKIVEGMRTLIYSSFSKIKEFVLYKPFPKTQLDDGQNSVADNRFKREKKYIEMIAILKKQEDRLLQEISILDIQNKTYLQTLKNYGVGRQTLTPQKSQKNFNNATSNSKLHKSFSKPLDIFTKNQNNQQQKHNNNKNNKFKQGTINNKPMNLSQLKDLIYEIYEAKIEYDKKCYSIKKSIETMEEFIYIYFNKKYGLKQITIEWATMIVNGIKNYAQTDPAISIFGRVLRNQFQQDYWKSQLQIKYSIEDMVLKQHRIQSSTSNKKQKNNSNNNDTSNLELHLNQILDVISKIYSGNDLFSLQNYIQQAILKQKSKSPLKATQKFNQTQQSNLQTLLYLQFINLVLEWQIKQHETLLQPFVQKFRLVDLDKDGFISTKEFKQLYSSCVAHFDQKQFANILEIADPWETDVLTFSTLCSLLQYQPESKPIISIDRL